MKQNLIALICCPINHDDLKLISAVKNKDGDIVGGKLISSNGIEYLIEDGIPNLIPKDPIISNYGESQNIYKTYSVPYTTILHKIGFASDKIAQMDALRFSIYSKTKLLGNKYLNGRVLELGAGENYLKDEFNSIYDDWISLDYDIRSNSIDLRGDGQQLPFKKELFDSIISIDVLEHVPNPTKFIAEMYRVLKPGGNIILSTPFFFYMHEEPNDYFRFSRYGLTALFERSGLSVLEVLPTAGFISTMGILITILITRMFKISTVLLRTMLRINRFFQLKLFLPLDKRFDKRNRFAQGHFIIAKKEI